MIWRLRCMRTSASTGSIDVATLHHRAHLVVGAVAALAPLLVGDGLVQREQRDAVARLERLLRAGASRPPGWKSGPVIGPPGLAAHLLDGGHHVLRQLGLLRHLPQGREVGEGLDAVAAVDGQALDRA